MEGKLQLGGRATEESVQGVTDYSHSEPVSWGDTVVSEVEHPEVIPQCLRDPTVGARRPPCGGVAHLTSFPEVSGLDAEGRELIPTCQSPSCLADSPPRRCVCCGPYGYGRCINWAEPVGVGPHRSGMLCANCVPTQGDSKCGCLCGECEKHDYNTEASPASPRHTPRSSQHKRSTPERRTGLLGGSDADPLYSNGRRYRGGRPYLEPLSAHDQQRLDDNYLEADDRAECYICMEPLHPNQQAPCGHRRHANILLDCCMCNAHRGPEAHHDVDDDNVKRKRPDRQRNMLRAYRELSAGPSITTPPSGQRRNSSSAGRSRKARFSRLAVTDHELVRNSDVYVARSTLNMNSTPKQRGRRGFRLGIVDAGWGLFAARDFKRDELVLDYRFVDGRGGIEVDRLDASQLEARYPDPLHPPTHVLRPHGSGISWDTLRCRGVGGFANSHTGHQNCLFRGSKIHVGSRSRKAGTELFLNYSYDRSYEWADEPEPEADFHHHPLDFSFRRPGTGGPDVAVSLTAAAGVTTSAGPTPHTVFPTKSQARVERRTPPWDRLRRASEDGSPPLQLLQPAAASPLRPNSYTHLTHPPVKTGLPRVKRTPAVGKRRSQRHALPVPAHVPLPPLLEDSEDLFEEVVSSASGQSPPPLTMGPVRYSAGTQSAPYPPTWSPREQDMVLPPQVMASVSSTTRPTQGVICFQRSRPGAWSPEILVYVDAGSTTFSGLPLAPPSANGWSSRSVTKSLKDFVAITPRVRQCLHRAVDRNPWGQVSEPSTALLRGLVRTGRTVSRAASPGSRLGSSSPRSLLHRLQGPGCDSSHRGLY